MQSVGPVIVRKRVEATRVAVWAFIVEARQRHRWWADSHVDARMDGAVSERWSFGEGDTLEARNASGKIDVFVPGHALGFRWRDGDDEFDTAVLFTLHSQGETTDITVTETGFGRFADAGERAADAEQGWIELLNDLAAKMLEPDPILDAPDAQAAAAAATVANVVERETADLEADTLVVDPLSAEAVEVDVIEVDVAEVDVAEADVAEVDGVDEVIVEEAIVEGGAVETAAAEDDAVDEVIVAADIVLPTEAGLVDGDADVVDTDDVVADTDVPHADVVDAAAAETAEDESAVPVYSGEPTGGVLVIAPEEEELEAEIVEIDGLAWLEEIIDLQAEPQVAELEDHAGEAAVIDDAAIDAAAVEVADIPAPAEEVIEVPAAAEEAVPGSGTDPDAADVDAESDADAAAAAAAAAAADAEADTDVDTGTAAVAPEAEEDAASASDPFPDFDAIIRGDR